MRTFLRPIVVGVPSGAFLCEYRLKSHQALSEVQTSAPDGLFSLEADGEFRAVTARGGAVRSGRWPSGGSTCRGKATLPHLLALALALVLVRVAGAAVLALVAGAAVPLDCEGVPIQTVRRPPRVPATMGT